ncbi:MAG: thiol-disulfide oxidoreductase DCC family protein [Bacteroidota bacterium]
MQHSILLFDGYCNLCNAAVDFVLKRDVQNQITVGSLQSTEGKVLLRHFGLPEDYLASLMLIEQEQYYVGSTAALKVAKKLDGLWFLLYPLILVPRFIREPIYGWISKNRYRWFGKKSTCRIAKEEEVGKFLTKAHPFFRSIE